MKKHLIPIFLSFLLLLYSCGGGGGGGAPAPTKSSVTVGGAAVSSIGLSSLVGASKASVVKAQTDEVLIGGARVIIESYHNGQLDKRYETVTDKDLGTFSTQLELWSDGGYIVVIIEKDGLVKYSKTFNYKTPADLKGLNLKAELAPYLKKVVNFGRISSVNLFKSAEADVLSIAVVESRDGQKRIATNSEIKVAKASGATVKLQMDLSKSMLKAAEIGESITIKAQNYDPTNEEDMKSFPADADNQGNKLVSTGFDFIDIKTSTGKSFCIDNETGLYGTLDSNGKCVVSQSSAAKQSLIKKSAVVTFRVKRQIEDCNIFNKDEDATKPGKQVGFYIYRNGKWLKLGNATLYGSDAFDNLSYGQLDDTKIATTCTDNNRPYAVFTEAEIKKASEDLGFDLSWWNFDYVAIGELKTFCVEGEFKKIKKNEKSPLGSLYLYLQDLKNNSTTISGFRASYGYTDENGKYKIEGVTSDIDVNYDVNLSYGDPFTGKWISKTKKLKAKAASGCYQLDVEEITDPFECSVTGKATKSDGSIYPNKYLYAYVKDKWYGYQYSYTDSNGIFTMPVICGEGYVLTDGIDTFDFNVNGTKSSLETDDTGKQVVLNLSFPNHKPYAYAYANQYSIKTGETVQLYGYGYDPDGDTLSYSWSSTSGTISSSTSQSPTWTAPNIAGNYTITLTVSDGLLSNTATVTIEVYTGNRPPKISYLYVPSSVLEGDTAYLYASAYDPDGDTLSYSWSVSSFAGTLSSSSAQNPTWIAPSTPGTYTITLSVSDGSNSSSQSGNIIVYADQNPVILSYNIPSIVTPGSTNSISAYAYDPEGKPVTYSWSLGGGTPSTSSSSSFQWTAPSTTVNVTVNLTVSDGKKSASITPQTISVKQQNRAPVIDTYNVPTSGGINQPITLSATASDPDGDSFTYSWYVDGNLIGQGASKEWTPRFKKTYTISLIVSDGALTATRSSTFTVTNSAPVISNVTVPSTATAGQAVTFSATANDADGDALTYTWFVNNVSIGQGATKSYTFTKKGTYKVKVSVTDGTATVTSGESTVTVPNQPPANLNVTVPSTATVGQAVTFSATATDADGDALTYTWFAGSTQIGQGASFNWTPTTGGTYSITVKVSDGTDTVTSTAKSISVNTKPVVSNITVSPSAPQSGETVTLTAVATDADGDTLTYEWYIQTIKQTGTGPSITWTPSSAGTYAIEVRVSDGRVSTPISFTKNVTVTGAVTNQPPTITTMSITEGANGYTLSVIASDPDNGPSSLTYTWYVDGQFYGLGQTLLWIPEIEKTYTIKIVVSDGAATAEQSQSKNVTTKFNIVIQ